MPCPSIRRRAWGRPKNRQRKSPAAAAGDEKKDAAEPQPEPGGDAPTKAFAGFRTERRVPAPEREPAPPTAPRPGGMPPWDSTPVTGIPRVDPTAYGAYYAGPDAPPTQIQGPPPRQEHLPHTPYPELSTGMLLRRCSRRRPRAGGCCSTSCPAG